MPQVAERAAAREILSTEVRLALAPDATYRRLLADEAAVSWSRMLRRPALVLLAIATAVPIMAMQRVTIGLVLTAALSWSVLGLLLFRGDARGRPPRATDGKSQAIS